MPVEILWVDMNPFGSLIYGRSLSHCFSFFCLSLNPGLFSWLLGILLELFCLYIVEFIYQVAFQSMYFLFNILKIQKNRHFSLVNIFFFEPLSLA
jgi:hypothetical protein